MTVQATNYDGSKSYNLLQDSDINWDVKRVTVNGVTCNFYKSNHLVICILQSTADLKNNITFNNMIPSGYNPKDFTCMNIIEVAGSSIIGQARFTFAPDLSSIGLLTTSASYVERQGVIAYYVD